MFCRSPCSVSEVTSAAEYTHKMWHERLNHRSQAFEEWSHPESFIMKATGEHMSNFKTQDVTEIHTSKAWATEPVVMWSMNVCTWVYIITPSLYSIFVPPVPSSCFLLLLLPQLPTEISQMLSYPISHIYIYIYIYIYTLYRWRQRDGLSDPDKWINWQQR